ncbi:MAG TPA: hypothetical protein PKG54_00280 [Phycisphaerae bacterium]|nr:hypothetical protein [Phycisphaerae bacterium]HOB72936.1 hypothetical protein [Phycisphaerae bacterium]HOJ53015.1 hypothetical protein [Phycisphaerae bacterium]HOL24752.1 hypothetical protein [Phycisphaerae bacterium]HPP19288.1 hypothetical protein [Phycisphaerae bacterium]
MRKESLAALALTIVVGMIVIQGRAGQAPTTTVGVLPRAPDNTPDGRSPLELLRSTNTLDNVKGHQAIREQRSKLIEGLLVIIDQDDDESDLVARWYKPKRTAMELLGELRPDDPATIRAIAKHLKYEVKDPFGGTSAVGNLDRQYPAVGALVRIGHPALPHAWYRIAMADDPLERELCA